jgi:hypothetical protein
MSDTNDSRIEKLLKAILGQEVQLEPRESRVEDLLYAILTGGSYDEPTLSEMEDILLCILHGERYDGPTNSRINALLKVKANGGDYDEPRLSRIEELIYEWINGGDISTYTGTLPTTLQTVAGYLAGYKIWGNTVQTGTPTPENPIMPSGCGERTGNLFSGEFSQFDNVGGAGNIYAYFYIPEDFTLTLIAKDTHTIPVNIFFGITKDGGQATGGFTWAISQRQNVAEGDKFTVESSINGYHYISMYQKVAPVLDWILEHYYVMLNLGTAPLPYVPFGYKLPILSNDTTTDIYIGDAQLAKDEYVDSVGKIYRYVDGTLTPTDPPAQLPKIPTFAGETTISYGGTGAQPEKVELKYR